MSDRVAIRTRNLREYLPSEIAVLISVLAHALALLSWEHRDLFHKLPGVRTVAALLAPVRARSLPETLLPTITFVESPAEAEAEPQRPRRFIETDDSQVTGEEPKRAEFYSDRSTVAANPFNPTGQEGETPYLEGTETRMWSTETVIPQPASAPRPPPAPPPPPRPAAPASPPASPPAAPATPEPSQPLADVGTRVIEEPKLALLDKPLPVPEPLPAAVPVPVTPTALVPVPEPSPLPAGAGSRRELAAVKSRLTAAGVGRIGVAAFNVAGSPFGEYDKALIRAVQSRWYALIEKNGLYERTGQVTLRFLLKSDGSVEEMTVKENTAGQILGLFCEKAVVDSAPFPPLPEKLRALIGDEPREVNFTFYY